MTLQEQYNQIKEGKGNKAYFLKQARYLFPDYINQYSNFDDTVNVLKGKNILSENKANLGMVSTGGRKDWFNLFQESVKAEEKKVSKEVTDKQAHAYDYKDMKNIDNVYGNTFLNGFYTEMQDPKNQDKSVDELKQLVAKNLGNDWNYYATEAQFGIKGIGYTKEAPGLGEPKEPKGKWKASGYGDLPEKTEKVKANTKDTLGDKEAKTTMPKKVDEMPVAPQSSKGVKKMPTPGKPKTIKLQESKLRTVIQQLIKEELNLKEIDEVGKMAEYQAKTKKIGEEIIKRKKKLKALTTLEEIESGSTNPKMVKSLKQEIKKLEKIKEKLDKKYLPKEEVIGEEEAAPVPVRESLLNNIRYELEQLGVKYELSNNKFKPFKAIYKPINKSDEWYKKFNKIINLNNLEGVVKVSLKEGYGMSLKDAKEEAQRISKEEGVVQHVEETEEGSGEYRVSDWYDSDLTVASYQNGMEL